MISHLYTNVTDLKDLSGSLLQLRQQSSEACESITLPSWCLDPHLSNVFTGLSNATASINKCVIGQRLLIILCYSDELSSCPWAKETPTKRPWDSVLEINWLSLMELAFSFLFPFCPHYLLLTSLLLVLCFSSAWRHSTAALPPPAVGGGKGLPDAQASQDGEGEEAGGRYQGETAFLFSSTYSLSCLSDPLYILDM